jgi:hypothetical protein
VNGKSGERWTVDGEREKKLLAAGFLKAGGNVLLTMTCHLDFSVGRIS